MEGGERKEERGRRRGGIEERAHGPSYNTTLPFSYI